VGRTLSNSDSLYERGSRDRILRLFRKYEA
jgi:hypothetical protein